MDNSKTWLISGGTGLVGTRLREMLTKRGDHVRILSRTAGKSSKGVSFFVWNPEIEEIPDEAILGADVVVNLAGAGVADARWTASRKHEIRESRISATRTLVKAMTRLGLKIPLISASAVGFYGDCGDELVLESRPPASTFLAEVCVAWEKEAQAYPGRTVLLRIGIVLSEKGGALPELSKTMPLGIAGWLAKQPLWYPWIHLDDLCRMIVFSGENAICTGPYNAAAPQPLALKDLIKAIITAGKFKALAVPVPPLSLRLAMGEMSDMLLSSQRCSADKIMKIGFQFSFPDAASALKAIYDRT
jgi:uncharacterized protein (TIGR01777 family)